LENFGSREMSKKLAGGLENPLSKVKASGAKVTKAKPPEAPSEKCNPLYFLKKVVVL
jgi:hypothetical protein